MAYPVIEGTSGGANASGSTTQGVVLPDNIAAGDLVVVIIATDGSGVTFTFPAGWFTINTGAGGAQTVQAYATWATADIDNFNITLSTIEPMAHISYRISGACTVRGQTTLSTGTSANPTVANYAVQSYPGVSDCLLIAFAGWDYNRTLSAYPGEDWTDGSYQLANISGGCGVATATLTQTANAVTGGAFTISASDTWTAGIIEVGGWDVPREAMPPVGVYAQAASYMVIPLAMPQSILDGDLIVFGWGASDTTLGTVTYDASFTELTKVASTNNTSGIAYLIAAGGETGSSNHIHWNGGNTFAAGATRVFRNAVVPEVASNAETGTTFTPDPPTLTTSWGERATLWVAWLLWRAASMAYHITGTPSNYVVPIHSIGDDLTAGLLSCSVIYGTTAAAENPDVFTIDNSTGTKITFTLGMVMPITYKTSSDSILLKTEESSALAAAFDTTDSVLMKTTEAGSTTAAIASVDTLLLLLSDSAAVTSATLTAADTLLLALTDGSSLTVTSSVAATILLALVEAGVMSANIASADTVLVSISEAVALAAALNVVDEVKVLTSETTAVAAALGVTDGLLVTIGDTVSVLASFEVTDSLLLLLAGTAEKEEDIIPKTVADTLLLALTDALTVEPFISVGDTILLLLSDSAIGVYNLATLDGLSISVTDTADLVVTQATVDSLLLLIGMASTLNVLVPVSDTLLMLLTDSAAQFYSMATMDGVALVLTDTAELEAQHVTIDTLLLTIADLISMEAVLAVTDTLLILLTDAAVQLFNLAVGDGVSLVLEDVASVGATFATTDALLLRLLDVVSLTAAIAASDELPLLLSDTAIGIRYVVVTDSAALVITEESELATEIGAYDIIKVIISQTSLVDAALGVADTLLLELTDNSYARQVIAQLVGRKPYVILKGRKTEEDLLGIKPSAEITGIIHKK